MFLTTLIKTVLGWEYTKVIPLQERHDICSFAEGYHFMIVSVALENWKKIPRLLSPQCSPISFIYSTCIDIPTTIHSLRSPVNDAHSAWIIWKDFQRSSSRPCCNDRLWMYRETGQLVASSYEVSQQHLRTQISAWVCIWAVGRERRGSWEGSGSLVTYIFKSQEDVVLNFSSWIHYSFNPWLCSL